MNFDLKQLMKIYTKGGDRGETGLFGGVRVPKDDLRIRTYGALDELNALLGMIITSEGVSNEIQSRLLRLQGEMFQVGAELATPRGKKVSITLLEHSQVLRLESEIDQMENTLTPLKNFILPGGTRLAALIHLARTVTRRVERELVSLNRAEPVRPVLLEYLNRLSDYFFVTARYMNYLAKVPDVPWIASSSS